RRGSDLKVEVELDLEEAFTGVTRDVTFDRHDLCGGCKGSGARAGTRPDHCGPCNGTGRIQRQQGFFMVQTACPVCRGQGTIIKDRCGDCGGDGFQRVQRSLSVKFPAGIGDGNRLRVQGEGDSGGVGGERGDLAIHVRVRPNPTFQRDGADVYLTRDIVFTQAVLGTDLEVPTLHGAQTVSIPAGTQTGTVLRLRNRGMPRLDGVGHGDQYVTLNVAIPSTLSPAQAELMEQLRCAGL
ncbi:MAG: molecular chaperone DnaJ, partial [Myxococcales bacterium]|nr:molecular chaperone DnaJ [Myxococcales bacterium]